MVGSKGRVREIFRECAKMEKLSQIRTGSRLSTLTEKEEEEKKKN